MAMSDRMSVQPYHDGKLALAGFRLSVPAGNIGEHLNASVWSEGVMFQSDLKGRDLWLDITHFPGTPTAAKAPAAIIQVGRLADDGFDRLVLAQGDQGLFVIERGALRDIGCQFIWGREGGQNPIALMRDLYRQMSLYDSGMPLGRGFTGSLLGDTSLALRINNEVLLPAWVAADVQ
jgi:hypothetical protein